MLTAYLEMHFYDHFKDENPKIFRLAWRVGHINMFLWRAAAEKWQIFCVKPSQK